MREPSQPDRYEIGRRRYAVAAVREIDPSGVRTVTAGTIVWAVAFVLLLPFWGHLSSSGHLWWLWTCAAGFGFGVIGIDHCRRRARRAFTS
ncbi:MAG: DUF2530 domain-containing protein [Marmoricola sp.]